MGAPDRDAASRTVDTDLAQTEIQSCKLEAQPAASGSAN